MEDLVYKHSRARSMAPSMRVLTALMVPNRHWCRISRVYHPRRESHKPLGSLRKPEGISIEIQQKWLLLTSWNNSLALKSPWFLSG